MTELRDVVRAATSTLREAGVASPDVDAVELAAHVLGVDAAEVRRLMIVGGSLTDLFEQSYAAVLAERARRVPLQHLTGRAHFRTLTLHVGPGVFVPRPETEVLVELALAEVDRIRGTRPSGIRLVDLCSGSGAIPFAVKAERPHVEVRALELSGDAVAWATANRDRLGLDVEIVEGDATEPAFEDWTGSVDLVTVNPPYIPTTSVPIDPEVRDHDPEVALYGGSEDGLAIPVLVAAAAAQLLGPGGLLLMEHADTQGESLPDRLARTGHWSGVVDHDDLSGRPRVTAARRA
ncbi:peptide chain release factor N(5)-glutamine methyltransferase [Intrasporangium sp. DVR]|uniref:peptide chain release factor N(5)-glutamine methyltransferase n=1 Tax=Intrasporangium sp. DVR TaxID=3127867 RepID=UPI00313A736B